VSRRRKRSEAYRTRRFIRRHPDIVASALDAAMRSELASVVEVLIGPTAADAIRDGRAITPTDYSFVDSPLDYSASVTIPLIDDSPL
jgi:hypothetical protein